MRAHFVCVVHAIMRRTNRTSARARSMHFLNKERCETKFSRPNPVVGAFRWMLIVLYTYEYTMNYTIWYTIGNKAISCDHMVDICGVWPTTRSHDPLCGQFVENIHWVCDVCVIYVAVCAYGWRGVTRFWIYQTNNISQCVHVLVCMHMCSWLCGNGGEGNVLAPSM